MATAVQSRSKHRKRMPIKDDIEQLLKPGNYKLQQNRKCRWFGDRDEITSHIK